MKLIQNDNPLQDGDLEPLKDEKKHQKYAAGSYPTKVIRRGTKGAFGKSKSNRKQT